MTDEVTSGLDPQAAIPWYKSKILLSIITGVLLQVANKIQTKYHVDIQVVTGVTISDLASWLLDAATGIAVAACSYFRVKQSSAPQITMTPTQAKIINQAVEQNLSSTQVLKASQAVQAATQQVSPTDQH
jgi:hypothetical protein